MLPSRIRFRRFPAAQWIGLFCLTSLTFGLLAAPAPAGAATRSWHVVIEPDQVHVGYRAGVDGEAWSVDGGGSWNQAGAPAVPFRPLLIAVPAGERVVSVTATPEGREEILDLGEPGEGHRDGRRTPTTWDGRSLFPSETLTVGDAGWMRGIPVQPLTLFPVRWDPASGTATLTTAWRIDVVTERAAPPPGTFLPERRGSEGEERVRTLLEAAVLNPEDLPVETRRELLRPKDSGANPFSPRFRPSVDGSPVQMVIITNDALASKMAPLATWKTERGITAVVRSVEWIRANYPNGVDLGETIRRFIADAVSRWGTQYVLLAGDADVIPIRYGKTLYFGGEEIPADMYYQCLDGNWNSDGDTFFGEGYSTSLVTGDGCDLYPDVWLGRAAVHDTTTAATFVNKLLMYEKTPPAGYLTHALMMAEVLFPQHYSPGDSVIYDGAGIGEMALSYFPAGFSKMRRYENYGPYAGVGALPEDKSSVIAEVNSGYGMIQHIGHGYINTMAVGIGDGALGNADATAFTNGDKLSVLYSINCTSAAIDYNCIGEAWLENPNGGAVADIGSTRFDFPGTGTDFQNEFYRLLLQVGVPSIGEAFAGSKIPFIGDSVYDSEARWTQFGQILLGDPSLRVWRWEPAVASVSAPASLPLGSSGMTVTVTRAGVPLDSAFVCLFKEGDDFETGVTNGAGQVTIPFRPDRPGTARLTVTHPKIRPWQSSIPVTAPAAPHLFASLVVVDDATPPAIGNGDSRFDMGETVRLLPTMGNQGTATATGITATLSTSDPNLMILDGAASWPSITPGGSAAPGDAFLLKVTGTATDRYETSATLTISAAGGYSRAEPIVILVGAPLLERYQLLVSDVGVGNGNGIIEANEDQLLTLSVRNNGRGAVNNLTAKLRPLDGQTTIVDSTSSFGSIASDAVGTGDTFQFRWSTVNMFRTMRLILQSGTTTLQTFDIDVSKPGVPTVIAAGGKSNSIAVTWSAPFDLDVRGYILYRSTNPGGPFTRVNTYADSRIAYYNDENLPPLTRFYYKVSTIDQSGNESATSSVAAATTTLSNANGFPLSLGGATSSSPAFSFFDGDTIPEIVTGGDELYVVSGLGTEFVDGDNDARTYGVYSSSGAATFWTPPASSDIDRDGVIDVCAAGWTNGLLYLYDGHLGTKPGFPVNIDAGQTGAPHTWSAPVMVDVDGDNRMEIFINSAAHTYAFHYDGSELIDGDMNPATHGVFATLGTTSNYSTPRIVDLDNDGAKEVVIASRDHKLYVKRLNGTDYPGFPVTYTADITSSPAIGDLNNDGLMEIVFGCSDNKLYAFNINKVAPPGWPKGVNFNQDLDSSPALADINHDGFLDVAVCAGNGTVYIFKGQDGTIFPGYPVVLLDSSGLKISIRSSPSIGNVDTNSDLEVVFGGQDGNVYALKPDGTMAIGFPIKTENAIEGGPMIWDLDGDGLAEVCVHGLDQRLYVWDTPAPFSPASCPWPMFGHDSRRTGVYGEPIFVVTGTDGPKHPPAIPLHLAQNSPNPFRPATTIRFHLDPTGSPIDARLLVYDPAGRLVRELFAGPLLPGDHEVQWDGRTGSGEIATSGVYFCRLEGAGVVLSKKMILSR